MVALVLDGLVGFPAACLPLPFICLPVLFICLPGWVLVVGFPAGLSPMYCGNASQTLRFNILAAQEKQHLIFSEVQKQKAAVTEAQWQYFEAALKQDQVNLAKVREVPQRVKAKLHQKTVAQRRQQAESGQKAAAGYADSRVKPV